MPIVIVKELSATPSKLVVEPLPTRLSFSVDVVDGPLSATITYTLPKNRPVLFASAKCTEPKATVGFPAKPSKTFTVKKFPLDFDRDVVVNVQFVLEDPPGASLTFDVDVTVLTNDGSSVDTSCDISF